MKILRAVTAGLLVWTLIFSSFMVLSFIPAVKDSATQQNLIVSLLILPFSYLGAGFYFKKGDKTSGLIVGVIMVITMLIMDAIITVPYMMATQQGDYGTFYTDYYLWVFVMENMAVNFLYWKFKVRSVTS